MKATRISAVVLMVAAGITLLVIAQKILIPLAVAIAVWFLVNAIADALGRIPAIGKAIPPLFRKGLASTLILVFIWVSVEIIISSVNDMVALAPSYQQRMNELVLDLVVLIGPSNLPSLTDYLQRIDLQPIFTTAGSTISGFAGDFFLVILYTIFLLVEQGTFRTKWKAMFMTENGFKSSSRTMQRVSASIREFALVKTGTNLAVALLSLGVMGIVGMDFSLFWAFLIFLLNFIPTFGSLGAVGLPSLFTMLQFEGMGEPAAVFFGVSAAHAVVGYLIEPRLMGRTLNISPLVILISLSVWGMIWGVIGMILAVPIMVSLMIVLAAVPYTRPAAIWLSADGLVTEHPEEEPLLEGNGL